LSLSNLNSNRPARLASLLNFPIGLTFDGFLERGRAAEINHGAAAAHYFNIYQAKNQTANMARHMHICYPTAEISRP